MYSFLDPLTCRESELSFSRMAHYPSISEDIYKPSLISEHVYKPSDEDRTFSAGCDEGGGDLNSIYQSALRNDSAVKDRDRQSTNSMKSPMSTIYSFRNDENRVVGRTSRDFISSAQEHHDVKFNHAQLFHDHDPVLSRMIPVPQENVVPGVAPMVSFLPRFLPSSSNAVRVPARAQVNHIPDQVQNQQELPARVQVNQIPDHLVQNQQELHGSFVNAPALSEVEPYLLKVGSSSSSPPDMLLTAEGSAAQTEIVTHPLYPYLVRTHVNCCKIGAEAENLKILDEVLSTHPHLRPQYDPAPLAVSSPELDNVMAQYLRMLNDLKEDIEEPFNAETEWCNEVFEKVKLLGPSSGPVEMTEGQHTAGDNEGFASTSEMTKQHGIAPSFYQKAGLVSGIIREHKVVKAYLKRKHDRSEIHKLRGQCMKKRRQGKHSDIARECLLEWFTCHEDWPYPAEEDKIMLAAQTRLEVRQVNNWFINQRKRHWDSPAKEETVQLLQYQLQSQRQTANVEKVPIDRFRVPPYVVDSSSYSWPSR